MSKLIIGSKNLLFRKGLIKILEECPYEVIIRELKTKDNLLHEVPDKDSILLLDINLLGIYSLTAYRKLLKKRKNSRIIIFYSARQLEFLLKLLELGILGFLPKNFNADELFYGIKIISNDNIYYPREIFERLRADNFNGTKPDHEKDVQLTALEKQVLKLIYHENTNKEIGITLNVSKRTVEKIRARLIKKFDARNTVGLVKCGVRKGLFSEPEYA